MSLRSVSLSGDLDNNYLQCDLSSAAVISTPSTVTQDLYLYPYRHKTILSFVCFIPQSTEIATQFLCDLINSRYQIDIRKWKCHVKRQCRLFVMFEESVDSEQIQYLHASVSSQLFPDFKFEVNQIWQSLVFLPHLLIFAVPGVLRNYPSRGGCACCRKQAGCISVNGVTLSHRDANSSNSTRKYLHTCIDCHRSGHSDCSYCGHATPSGIIL